ncbi:MAG TPA: hypothetical protein VND98_08980, partial [Solirubrobacterales bacterium]|nr:hypothetical protein [Solirubrobacterales bacterium]
MDEELFGVGAVDPLSLRVEQARLTQSLQRPVHASGIEADAPSERAHGPTLRLVDELQQQKDVLTLDHRVQDSWLFHVSQHETTIGA